MSSQRIILHVDQNCFFASVGMIYHPEMRNVPMAVAGDKKDRHGIILAKNQLASSYGVKTAEAIWQAQSKCPGLQLLAPEYDKYEFYSKKLKYMYAEYTDQVEPFGLDECWLDMTGILKDFEEAEEFADMTVALKGTQSPGTTMFGNSIMRTIKTRKSVLAGTAFAV